MAAIESLCKKLGITSHNLSKEENLILEAELYVRICNEIIKTYIDQNKEYFRLIKINSEMENKMIDSNLIRCLVNDILKSRAYTLSGIAHYTHLPEEVINDLLINCYSSPILSFGRRIIELHREARPDIYLNVIKKIASEQTETKNNAIPHNY